MYMFGLQLSELFTYLNTFIIAWEQQGLDNWESTVYKKWAREKILQCSMSKQYFNKYLEPFTTIYLMFPHISLYYKNYFVKLQKKLMYSLSDMWGSNPLINKGTHMYSSIVWHGRHSLHPLAGFSCNPQSIVLWYFHGISRICTFT